MSGHLVAREFYKLKTVLLLSKSYWDLSVGGDMSVISALERLRQEDTEVETRLGYVLRRLCLYTIEIVGMNYELVCCKLPELHSNLSLVINPLCILAFGFSLLKPDLGFHQPFILLLHYFHNTVGCPFVHYSSLT